MKKEELAKILTATEAIALRAGRVFFYQRKTVSKEMIYK
jgi:hypothetical protein